MSRTAFEVIMRADALGLPHRLTTKSGAKELAKIIYNQDFFDLPKEKFLDGIIAIIDSFESDSIFEYDVANLFSQELDDYYDETVEAFIANSLMADIKKGGI